MTKKLTEQQKKTIAENKKWEKEHPIEAANLNCAFQIITTISDQTISKQKLKEIETSLKKLNVEQFSEKLIMSVAVSGNLEIIRLFIKKGLNPNKEIHIKTDKHSVETSFFPYVCAHTTDPQVIEFLIDAGAIVNQFDEKNLYTPLMNVCTNFRIKSMSKINQIVKLLIEHGAFVDFAEKKSGANAVILCILYHPEDATVIKTLLAAGSDVNFKDKFGSTPIMYAARYARNKEIIDVLLDAGANTDKADIMTQAFKNENPDVKEYIIQKCLGITSEMMENYKENNTKQQEVNSATDTCKSWIIFAPLIFTIIYGFFVKKIGWIVIPYGFASMLFGSIVTGIFGAGFDVINDAKLLSIPRKNQIKYLICLILICLECYFLKLFLLDK